MKITADLNEKNNLYSINAYAFNAINMRENIDIREFIQNIEISNDELLSINLPAVKGQGFFITALMVGKDYNFQLQLINGEKIKAKEFNEEIGVFVTKSLEENIYEESGESWIYFLGDKYKVLGIIKSYDKEREKGVYINLDTMLRINNIESNILNYTYTYDGGMNTESKVVNLKKKLEKDINVDILPYKVLKGSDALKYSLKANKIFIIGIILLTIVMILTIINIITYWIERERFEISINRLVGATKLQATYLIIKKYLSTAILSIIFSFISFEVLKYFNFLNVFYIDNSNLIYDIFGLFIIFIIEIMISIIPIVFIVKKIYRLSIDLAVRGGKR